MKMQKRNGRHAKVNTNQEPKKNTWKNVIPLISVAVPVFLLDQVSKWLVEKNIPYGTDYGQSLLWLFNLRHDRNSGAAFSILSGQRTLLIILTVLALVFIFLYYFRFQHIRWMQISLGFLLGGAVGNSIDRIFNENGEVVDFLQFAFWTAWPTFNIADISVCIGAGMLIVYLFQNRNQHQST